jgi:hypothetical protein
MQQCPLLAWHDGLQKAREGSAAGIWPALHGLLAKLDGLQRGRLVLERDGPCVHDASDVRPLKGLTASSAVRQRANSNVINTSMSLCTEK